MDETSVNNAGKELLDATQEAVIDAADNVETILKNTSQDIAVEHETFYLSAEFWVAMSFVLAVVVLFVPIKKALIKMLRQYSDKEAGRIDSAEELKKEARKLLADYEKRLEHAKDEAAQISRESQDKMIAFKKETLTKLEQEIAAGEKNSKERIASERIRAESELLSAVSERTVEILQQTISTHLGDGVKKRLVDDSIKFIENLK